MNSEDFIRIAEYIKENYVSKEEWENDLVAHTLINIQYSIWKRPFVYLNKWPLIIYA